MPTTFRLRRAVVLALGLALGAVACTERVPLLAGASEGGSGGVDAPDARAGEDMPRRVDPPPGVDADGDCQELIEGVPLEAGNVQIIVALDRSYSMMNRRLGDNDRSRLQTTRLAL